jgi:hypothetical protein
MLRSTPQLSDKGSSNVSNITALNAQKDKINELGSVQFAAEMGQTLTHFYSINRSVLLMLQKRDGKVKVKAIWNKFQVCSKCVGL